ncbi:MAG: hypothetical protein L6V95_00795 [Candidatus Melainabacteria bacterium]|nr:MAG: hypothetical protein L6V95_00795 [Candidatus Melainabacteria bacterium]
MNPNIFAYNSSFEGKLAKSFACLASYNSPSKQAARSSPFLLSFINFDKIFAGATWSPKPKAIAVGSFQNFC